MNAIGYMTLAILSKPWEVSPWGTVAGTYVTDPSSLSWFCSIFDNISVDFDAVEPFSDFFRVVANFFAFRT